MTNVQKRECVVVGGGLIGLLSAYLLAKGGLKVTVIERQQVGKESSWAGGGILSPLYPWRYPDGVTQLVAWGREHFAATIAQLIKEGGIDPQWLQCGLLILDQQEQQQGLDWAAQHGVDIQQISPQAARQRAPALAGFEHPVLRMPQVGQVRNPRLLAAVRSSALAAGVEIIEHAPIQRLLVADGRIEGVETADKRYLAERVVVAAGAWSDQLLQPLGINLQVVPVRGQMMLFKASPQLLKPMILNSGRYLIPRKDGRILVGSTVEYCGFAKETTEQAYQDLYGVAITMLPSLASYPVEKHWAGLRPGSPDGVPIICEAPGIEGLYLNCGHFRNGVVLSLGSCRLLADLVLGEPPILDADPYRIAGFPGG